MPEVRGSLRVCILGATSAIAEHTARRLAARGDRLALVGRNSMRLGVIAADLASRGASMVAIRPADLAGALDAGALLGEVSETLGGLDAVLIFHGLLGEQGAPATRLALAAQVLEVNFVSPALLSLAAAARLESSDAARPVIVAIGSVAGDRGRASNFVYGAAKGGLATLYQGLHHGFARQGSRVRAVLIKAGFVDTPMTKGFDRGGLLWAKPDDIAAVVLSAMAHGGPIVYAPWFWRWIMLIIRLLPQPVMDRIDL